MLCSQRQLFYRQTNTQNHHRKTEKECKEQCTTKWKKEYKDEFKKRPCVEGPFGIFKEQFHIEQEIVIGVVKTEERLNLDALAYNIKRLYNLKQEKNNNKDDMGGGLSIPGYI